MTAITLITLIVMYCFVCWIGWYVWENYDNSYEWDICDIMYHESSTNESDIWFLIFSPIYTPFVLAYCIIQGIVVFTGEFIIGLIDRCREK